MDLKKGGYGAMLKEQKKIKENEEFIMEELRQHEGWGEVKIKNGYIVEARKKVIILGRNK